MKILRKIQLVLKGGLRERLCRVPWSEWVLFFRGGV